MKQLFSVFMPRAALWLLKRHYRASVDLLRIESAGWYVRGIGAARQLFVGLLALLFILSLAVAGFVLLHVGLFALLPAPTGAIVLLVLGTIYFLVGLLTLRWAMAEKTWMKHSKATEYVNKALGKAPTETASHK